MQRNMGCYPVDGLIEDLDLPEGTRWLMHRYFSGNGVDSTFFLLAEDMPVEYMKEFISGCRKDAENLDDKKYGARELLSMGIAVPAGSKGSMVGKNDLLLFFDETIYRLEMMDGCGKTTGGTRDIGIDALWRKYTESGRQSLMLRDMLIEHYRPLVKYTAERLHSKLPEEVELDDLISSGIFGLMDAIDAFDPTRGVKFETYAPIRIKGAILDEIRNMDWVPRLVRSRVRQATKATELLEAELGREPNKKEIARMLELSEYEFEQIKHDTNAVGVSSIDAPLEKQQGRDAKEGSIINLIGDHKSTDPPADAQRTYLKELLSEGLTRAERLVVMLYYYEEMSMKEIGQALELSESRVSQIHSSIIARLKARLSEREYEFLGNTDKN